MRFSLKAMLLVVTVLGLFLGYSQVRRRTILRQVKKIEELGGRVTMPNELRDYFWQRRPTEGEVTSGFFIADQDVIDRQYKRKAQAEEKMKSLGVTKIVERTLY